jgi:hypothetical protein
MRDNSLFLVIAVILVLAIVGGIIFGIQTSNNITTNKNDITALKAGLVAANSSISSNSDQLTAANNQISSLKALEASDVAALKTQITSLTDQLNSANSQISALKTLESSDIAALKTQLGSLSDQIAAVNTAVTNLKSLESTDVTALKASLATLQTSVTTLQTSVTTLSNQVANLTTTTTTTSSTLFSGYPISSQVAGGVTQIYSFTPASSGTLFVSGSSTSALAYIRITNNNLATFVNYAFGTGTTLTISLVGGVSYSISFFNTEAVNSVSATLTATFTGTGGSGNPSTVFSPISGYVQGAGAQTQIAAYSPATTGNFYISGTSSSTTSQIVVSNVSVSPASTSTYTFSTGATLTIPGIAGNNYYIYIKNSDASSVTWSLTGQYY